MFLFFCFFNEKENVLLKFMVATCFYLRDLFAESHLASPSLLFQILPSIVFKAHFFYNPFSFSLLRSQVLQTSVCVSKSRQAQPVTCLSHTHSLSLCVPQLLFLQAIVSNFMLSEKLHVFLREVVREIKAQEQGHI